MKTKTDVLLGIALAIASTVALAGAPDPGATALLQKLKELYPATRFTSVTGTPIDGVYEVVMGQNVAYVGGDGRHLLVGLLVDMRTQQDLTAA
jgi:thiol:disulfide interchange protein DsbC